MGERRATKWGLGFYFLLFLIFLYGPMIVMAVISLQGASASITFPLRGFSLHWWEALWNGEHSSVIKTTTGTSLRLGAVVGGVTALLSLTLSMAYRRRFRGDTALFYIVILALMTPGFVLGLGTLLFWKLLGIDTHLWPTALGTNAVWGLPFAFLVMIAVWNRYDRRIEEAARDLGASPFRTFREVTLPLIWTGVFGAFLFGFTLSWNEYDRTALVIGSGENTLPAQIVGLLQGAVVRPDFFALGAATTLFTLLIIAFFLVGATIFLKVRGAGKPPEVDTGAGAAELSAAERMRGEPPAGVGARAE